ncbi:hypothetical protein F2P56_025977 [Juglans regia]|uniref:Protein EMBRYONIC FLOWER 1 isoform X2 n=2 Tax=Juglans regia TaxID=51240 RepID=A0A2I4GNR8_JUGRE|nr:protein EMBRYONIC FLOWER 1 isoform X2 [Juglans regia]KAF5456502.1 hypothetical protein F2P56_025977 [Juglans regia]
MERSIVEEENLYKSNSNTVSKSEGSFIQIDSISIDLGTAKDNSDAGKCEHFSIRGYVSEIRKKDWKICCPFSLEVDQTESEEQTSFLPHLEVPKFRWWHCQNCLNKVAARAAAKDYGTLFNCCGTKCGSNSNCSHVASAAMLLPGFQQAPKPVLGETTSVVANTSTILSNDNQLLLCSDKKQKKVEVAHGTIIEENLNQEILKLTSAAPEVNSSIIQERHTNDTVALKLKCNGSIEFNDTGSGSHEVSDWNLKCMIKDSAKHYQTGTQNSPDDQHIKVTKACQTLGLGSMVAEAPNVVKAHTTVHSSLELDEFSYESSESVEIMVDDDPLDHYLDKSCSLHRRKTRKHRLLTDLLGENGDAKSGLIDADNFPSNRTPEAFERLDMLSVPQGLVAIQGNTKRGSCQTTKRKLPQDEEWRPPEIPSPNYLHKKVQIWKGDSETTDVTVGNESQEAIAGMGFKTDLKSHSSKGIKHRSPTIGKKKNKKIQVVDAYLSLAPPQVTVQKEIQDKTQHTSDRNAAGNVSFGLTHNAFKGRQMDPFPFPALRMERKPNMCHKKNKSSQADGGQASLFPWNNGVLKNDPISRGNVDIMQTGSVTNLFQSTQGSLAEKELRLSLNSFSAAPRYDKEFIPRVEGGVSSFPPWQEVSPKVDQVMRKNLEVNNFRDQRVPSKSPPATYSGKGVNCEVSNEMTTFKMPFLNEMQNCLSQVEDRGCSQIQQRGPTFCKNIWEHRHLKKSLKMARPYILGNNCSGASNIDKAYKAKEYTAVGEKNSDQKADKASEQGPLDDIPMEIVELLTKMNRNTHERHLPDAVNKKGLLETTSNTINSQMTDCTNTYGNDELRLLEITRKQKYQARNGRNGIITTGQNVGTTKQKPFDFFSHIDRNHLNASQLDQTQTPPIGFRTFAQCQKKPSSGVQSSVTDPSRHSSGQNCNWNAAMVGHGPSHATLQTLGGCNTRQTVAQQNETAVHLWPTMITNQSPFGYNLPQKGVAQSTNLDMLSQCPDSLHKGGLNFNHDLKCFNLNATGLEKHNMSCGSETFSRNNAEYPLACKLNGMGHPQSLMGSLDLYSNETIPAMHLLSLMDAGMRSGPTFSMGGTPKFPKRPSFPHDPKSKELPRMEIGAYKTVDSMKQPPSVYCSKSHFSEKAHGCFHCIPTVAASASSFQHEKGFQRGSNLTSQVGLKSRERDKKKISNSATQSRGRRPEKFVFPTGSLGTNHGAIPVHSLQKRLLDASDSTVFALQHHGMDNSTQHPKSNSVSEICSINRNPADFIMPGAGNTYMIRGEDLKLRKVTPSQSRRSIIKSDGRKRHRNLKHTTVKERVQH